MHTRRRSLTQARAEVQQSQLRLLLLRTMTDSVASGSMLRRITSRLACEARLLAAHRPTPTARGASIHWPLTAHRSPLSPPFAASRPPHTAHSFRCAPLTARCLNALRSTWPSQAPGPTAQRNRSPYLYRRFRPGVHHHHHHHHHSVLNPLARGHDLHF